MTAERPNVHRGGADTDPTADAALAVELAAASDLVAAIGHLRPTWWRHAACRGADLATFYPGKGGSTAPALAICAECPVVEPCAAEAVADPELDHGIRGGLTIQQRKAARRRRAA